MFGYSSPLYSGMLCPSLILAVALTTARADTYFSGVSPCVVREGQCDSTVLDNTGRPMTNWIVSQTLDDLQQCADQCKVQSSYLSTTIVGSMS